jgi:alpha-tubulin suppressor-like RCC1 family protein
VRATLALGASLARMAHDSRKLATFVVLLASCSIPGVDYTGKLCPCTEEPYICHPEGFCVASAPGHPRCDTGGPFELAAGDEHTCSIECGALYCWGAFENGRLGLGAIAADVEHPTRVGTRTDWLLVSTGSDHTCAIDAQQDTWCWGSNASGAVGVGRAEAEILEPEVVESFGLWRDISAGSGHTCGVRRDGTLWCWGSDVCGKLGLGTIDVNVDVPTELDDGGPDNWVAVRAGVTMTCALREDGGLYCWGCNDDGQLATGELGPPILWPRRIDHPSPFVSFDAGQQHVCAIDSGGALFCWGLNEGGQVGIGTREPANVPAVSAVDPGALYTTIEADGFSSCALRTDESVRCWGYDLDGMLGRGVPESDYQLSPGVVVGFDGPVRDIAVGRFHTCVRLDASLSISCVGNDESGQVGTGAQSRRNFTFAPVPF